MLPYSGVVVVLTVEALIGQTMYHTQFAELTFSVPWMLVYFGWQPRSIGELRTGKTRREGLKMYGVAKSLIEGYYRPVCDMAYISPQNLESPYAGTLSFHSLPTTYYLLPYLTYLPTLCPANLFSGTLQFLWKKTGTTPFFLRSIQYPMYFIPTSTFIWP